MDDLVIIGTGSMARDIIAFVNRYSLYNIIGFACSPAYVESSRKKHPEWHIVSDEELAKTFDKNKVKLFVAISQFQNLNKVRREKFETLKEQGWSFATLISPTASVYTDHIGEGCWIMDRAYIGVETVIKENTFIDIDVYIAHYCNVDSHVYVAGRSMLMGSVKVGKQSFIGAGSTVFNDVTIGSKCIIGGATTIKRDIQDFTVVKLPNDCVVMKQYSECQIESKLIPPQIHKQISKKNEEQEKRQGSIE